MRVLCSSRGGYRRGPCACGCSWTPDTSRGATGSRTSGTGSIRLSLPQGGGTLRLPDEPEFEYHDAICTDAGAWSSLFEDGHGDVEFALLDPVAYGMERVERGASFEVGGTWPTWPTFELVASAGSAVQVSYSGKLVRIEHSFTGGEVVHIDCEREVVTVDGADARADVTLASDLSTFPPGACDLSVTGCANFEVRFRERWL